MGATVVTVEEPRRARTRPQGIFTRRNCRIALIRLAQLGVACALLAAIFILNVDTNERNRARYGSAHALESARNESRWDNNRYPTPGDASSSESAPVSNITPLETSSESLSHTATKQVVYNEADRSETVHEAESALRGESTQEAILTTTTSASYLTSAPAGNGDTSSGAANTKTAPSPSAEVAPPSKVSTVTITYPTGDVHTSTADDWDSVVVLGSDQQGPENEENEHPDGAEVIHAAFPHNESARDIPLSELQRLQVSTSGNSLLSRKI